MIKRALMPWIKRDLKKKMILLSGPRQCGKTFLSRNITNSYDYLNFDSSDDRTALLRLEWDRTKELVVFDEIHKMKNWKRWLKGIYDKEGLQPQLLITGSARMDSFRKTGDSLAGRHFLFRMHPLSVKEVVDSGGFTTQQTIDRFLAISNFPEPFLEDSPRFYRRWAKGHTDRMIRQDLIELESVRSLIQIETLIVLLSQSVGSTISYSSLARTLEVSPHTVKNWIQLLESLFIVFVVRPFVGSLAKSILKEPKVYFYDVGKVASGSAAKFENLIACHLLKECHYLEDTDGVQRSLHYVKDKSQREVDFVTVEDNKPLRLIEVKQSMQSVSDSLRYFNEKLIPQEALQISYEPTRKRTTPTGVQIQSAETFLMGLET